MDSVGSGGEFEGPAPTLIIRIICIWIAGGNGKHSCPQAVSHYMGDERWVMVKADSGQLVYQAELPVGTGQQQQAAHRQPIKVVLSSTRRPAGCGAKCHPAKAAVGQCRASPPPGG
jgi:hypothetical protein